MKDAVGLLLTESFFFTAIHFAILIIERERASTDFIAPLGLLVSSGIVKHITDSHSSKHSLPLLSSCHALTFLPLQLRLIVAFLSLTAADGARPTVHEGCERAPKLTAVTFSRATDGSWESETETLVVITIYEEPR